MMNGCGEGPEVRGSNPVWSFVDLNGKQFDDTFYMWVLENTIPYIPATVWHDAAGTLPWTDPIQFLSNGTLPVDIYWDPSKFYRLEFRQNVTFPPTQADPLIYLVENYSPNNAPMTPVGGDGITTDNQISNPQFAEINFFNPFQLMSVTNPASIEIGPDWFLDLTGTGTVLIERTPLNTTIPTPTNAPYALHINLSGGWTSAALRQRFQQNGQNWQNKTLSTSLTARITGSAAAISAVVVASNGQPLTTVLPSTVLTNTFAEYTGNALVAAFTNTDLPPAAYIDYKILLPGTIDLYITSIQLIASDVPATNFGYEQITVDRQVDHLFHYYGPQLAYKPIPSYLTGWDFPFNPAQFGLAQGPFATGDNTANYVWDQTIIFQTKTNGFLAGRASADNSLKITANVATGQVALVQYLGPIEAKKILQDKSSVRMSLYGNVVAGATGTVTLWATTDASLPTLPTCFFTGLDSLGVPTGAGVNWVQVPNVFQNDTFDVPLAITDENDDIVKWVWDIAGQAPATTATFFAMVVGFSSIADFDTLNVNSISLCAGEIPTRPAPKTLQQTLQDCEYYYEKSYSSSVAPATVTAVNQLTAAQGVFIDTQTRTVAGAFDFSYKTVKRITSPTVTLYAPSDGTSGSVDSFLYQGGAIPASSGKATVATYWTLVTGDKGSSYAPAGVSLTLPPTVANTFLGAVSIKYHYVVNARLGIV